MINYKQQRNTRVGFTLIETIVALAIFSASIVGLIVVSSQGIADTDFAKNKLAASYLAQEGVEIVRNMRDTSSLNGAGWASLLNDLDLCFTGCDINTNSHSDIRACMPTEGCALDYNFAGFFVPTSQNSTNESIFRRVILIENLQDENVSGDPEQIRVSSKVFWRQGNAEKSLIVNSILFNWQQ